MHARAGLGCMSVAPGDDMHYAISMQYAALCAMHACMRKVRYDIYMLVVYICLVTVDSCACVCVYDLCAMMYICGNVCWYVWLCIYVICA